MANDRERHADTAKRLAQRSREDAHGGESEPANPVLRLQQQVGNQQVMRMLAQRLAPEEDEEGTLQATHDASLQRLAPEEDEEGTLQASPEVGLAGGPVSDALASRINTQRGRGSPLESSLRTDMEGALDTSFEGVRVHGDAESHQLNRSISAKAFTTGNDIFLGKDASAGDRNLMVHELTHVVQQRSMSSSGPMTVGPAGDSYERQADATAAQVTQVQRAAGAETEEQ
jgi:hypothetical protein